jgi:hypothetical protein
MPLITTRAGGSSNAFGGIGAKAGGPTLAGFMTLGTQRVTSNTTQITFSSIPQTLKNLHFRGIARATGTGNRTSVILRTNGDTGSNYYYSGFNGGGSLTNISMNADNMFAGINSFPQSDAPANTSGVFYGDLFDYTATKLKAVKWICGGSQNTDDTRTGYLSGSSTSTSPITSLEFLMQGYQFAPGSTISLYGTV